MATFTLDSSKLGGGQYNTVAFPAMGEFRDLQIRCYQSVASQDMEAHILELFMSVDGVDEALS